MITAHGSEKIAVEAMKAGAFDYVPKPFDNDEIRLVLRRALERTRLERENRILRERIDREWRFENLIGSGAGMAQVFETIRKVAETDLTVLVRGESGTGKELVAQALHQRSRATRAALRRGQLRGDQPRAGRERTLRPREGRLHGRRRAPRRQVRSRARRHDLPRRDRRHAARDAGEGAARAPGAQPRTRRRQSARSTSTCASSPRRTAISNAK